MGQDKDKDDSMWRTRGREGGRERDTKESAMMNARYSLVSM